MRRSAHLLRARGDGRASVTQIELFFDLVFVFAVTQVSHFLLEHLDPLGASQAALLFAALWWVWNYTAWVTNWLEPAMRQVRGALIALMLAGLALSTSLPEAFAARGAVFASAYVAMQLGRTLFMLWAVRGASDHVRNFQRIACWTAASGTLWLVGGFGSADARSAWWSAALAVDLLSPLVAFWTPVMGRADTAEWDIDAAHFAERCAGFVLIALGESVVVIGASFADARWNGATVAAFASAFVGAASLWWIYFDTAAENTLRAFEEARDRGATARIAYTYLHALLIAGIVVVAVGDKLLLAAPHAASDAAAVTSIVGGAALFLTGNAAFRRALHFRMPMSHVIGVGLLAAVALAAELTDRLALGLLTIATLLAVAALETTNETRRRRRSQPARIAHQ